MGKTILANDSRFHFVHTKHTTIRVCEATTVNVSGNGQYDGGSREDFERVAFRTVEFETYPTIPRATFPQTYQTVETIPGTAIVCYSTFKGKSTPPTVYLHPDDYARMTACNDHEDCRANPEMALACAQTTVATDARTREILDTFGYKAGPYRQEEQRRKNVSASELDDLVVRGLLKRASNGSLAITPKGKTARSF